MTRLILIFCCLFVFIGLGNAQVKGGVSIHSDPRLGMLLKSSRPVSSVAENNTESSGRTANKTLRGQRRGDKGLSLPSEKPTHKEKDAGVAGVDLSRKIPPKVGEERVAPKKGEKIKPVTEEEQQSHRAVVGVSSGGRYSGKGFRVQIYNGTSRYEALRRKAEFMRNYPGVPTYLIYSLPYYKLKVGDFRRREDAVGMYHEANGTYSPCMIVPDEVNIHTN